MAFSIASFSVFVILVGLFVMVGVAIIVFRETLSANPPVIQEEPSKVPSKVPSKES